MVLEATPSGERPAAGGLPFQVRGQLHTLLSLRLVAPDSEDFFPRLVDKIAHAPDFFRNAPLVLDVAPIAGQPPIDLPAFVGRLRQHRLVTVGIQNGDEAWNAAAQEAGLSVFPEGRAAGAPRQEREEKPAPPAEAPEPQETLVVREPVRAGQQIYARGTDLVVLAPVSNGAEVMADGHVHIYSRLRGRAFAGVSGNQQALIFCDSLEAELVCIAGVYQVSEEIEEAALRQRVRISCAGERLEIARLG